MTTPQRLRNLVLKQADHLISNTRAQQYGDATQGFEHIAELWSAAFRYPFSAEDVAVAMILVKVARLENSPTHLDSWTDIAGYAALGAEVAGALQPAVTDTADIDEAPSLAERERPDPEQKPTLTVEEAAALLNLSRVSAYNAVKSGEIPSIRIGRRILIPTAALLEMLAPTDRDEGNDA